MENKTKFWYTHKHVNSSSYTEKIFMVWGPKSCWSIWFHSNKSVRTRPVYLFGYLETPTMRFCQYARLMPSAHCMSCLNNNSVYFCYQADYVIVNPAFVFLWNYFQPFIRVSFRRLCTCPTHNSNFVC